MNKKRLLQITAMIMAVTSLGAYGATNSDPKSSSGEFRLKSDFLLMHEFRAVFPEWFSTMQKNCPEKAPGSGSCGGYNSDYQRNCDCGSRPVTYRCTDGSTVQGCEPDQYCKDTNCKK